MEKGQWPYVRGNNVLYVCADVKVQHGVVAGDLRMRKAVQRALAWMGVPVI
ncbi:MAG: hypothetical protein LUC50_01195 [Ruminococcus sp.]|nr:hypothetical protein [Ruminococcus sp.]